MPWVSRSVLETAVWNGVKQLLLDPDKLHSRINSARRRTSEQQQQLQQRKTERSLTEIEKTEFGLFKRYQAGEVSAEQLQLTLEPLQREKAELIQSKPAHFGTDTTHGVVREYCDQIKELLEEADFSMKERILRHVITTALVDKESVAIQGAIAISSCKTLRMDGSTPAPLMLTSQSHNDAGLRFEVTISLPPRKYN